MPAPILFIHYGPAHYLKWALEVARRTNPEKRIVLLGDPSNRRFARRGVEFIDFETLRVGEKEREFQKVFQVIQGERHRFHKHAGIEVWLKFVFRRWFLIEAFLSAEKIDSFWTFDSDTLVLSQLAPRENRFRNVDSTTQCRGNCLNGWVRSADLVAGYTSCILALFRDEKYLDSQRQRLLMDAGLAFNEMDAFTEFRRRRGFSVRRASELIDGEAFDDALAFVDDFEVAPEKVLGKTEVKRIWTDGKSIFAKQNESGQFVRLLTCNMSWMPDYMWRRIIATTIGGGGEGRGTRAEGLVREEYLREISVREPVADRILRQAKVAVFRMRRALRFG